MSAEKPTKSGRPSEPLSLHQKFLGSAAWTGGSRVLLILLGLGVTAVLARLLAPSEYGLMGMAMVFIGLVDQMRDFGIGQAVVQRRTINAATLAQAFTMAALVSLVLCVLCWLIAPLVALIYDEPRVTPLLRFLALALPLTAFQVLPLSLLRRELRMRGEAISRTTATVADSMTTIVLAWLGFGVWALAIGMITNGLVFAVALACFMPWRPAFRLRGDGGPSLLRFGSGVTLSSFLWYLYNRADFLIIGRVLGSSALGTYTMAWRLAKMPWTQMWVALNPMVLPFLSRSRDEVGGMSRPFVRLSRGLSLLTFPILAGLAVVAGEVVPAYLGPKWVAVTGPLRWLCLYGIFHSAALLLGPTLLAGGRVARNVAFSAVCAVVLPVGFLVASRWGIAPVAAVWASLYPVLVAALLLPPALAVSGTPLRRYASILLRPALATTAMVAVVLTVGLVPGLTGALLLAVKILAGILTYASVLWLLEGPGLLKTVRDTLKEMRAGAEV